MSPSKWAVATAVAAALALTAACSSSDGGGPAATGQDGTTTLRVQTLNIYSDAALALGVEQGFFKDEGLTIEKQLVPNPPAGIAAVQGGQSDLAYTPSIPFLNATAQGVPLRVVAAADGYPAGASDTKDPAQVDDTGLYAAKGSGVTNPKELEGKAVAIPARKAQLEVTISEAVKDAGGDPSKVQWIVLDFPSAVQALDAGRVAAAGLVSPFTSQAASKGHTLISSPGLNFFKEGAVGLWVTSESSAQEKKTAIDGFRAAINKSNAYANDHLDAALAKAAELTKVDPKVVTGGATPYWPTEVTQTDIDRVADQLKELGFLSNRPDTSNLILSG